MNSKTSLFNKTLIKTDLRRFWWLGVLNILAILIFAVYPLYMRIPYNNINQYRHERLFIYSDMYRSTLISVPIIIIFAIAAVLLVFSYINKTAPVSFMHGLPLKRKTHFASHLVSGLTLTLSPAVISAVILLIMRINTSFANIILTSDIFKWLLIYAVYSVFVFSGTLFSAFLSGNSFGAVGIAGGFALLPVVATGFADIFMKTNLYGYYANDLYTWLKWVYLFPDKILGTGALIYICGAVVLCALAYWLYKIRNLENYGEVVAFAPLRPVFVYLTAAFISALGYMYLSVINGGASLWWILVFGIMGVIAAYMISNKSFSLKGAWKPSSIVFVCFMLLFISVKCDIFGYERRVPKLSKIDGVCLVSDDSIRKATYVPDVGKATFTEVYKPIMTNKEDIENVRTLHKTIIKTRETGEGVTINLPITYRLSNGRTVRREYNISPKTYDELLGKLYETQEMKYSNYPVCDPTQKEFVSVTISDLRLTSLSYYEDNKEMMNRIAEAFKKDVENLKYEDDCDVHSYVGSQLTKITFSYWKPMKDENGKSVSEELCKNSPIIESHSITPKYENTYALLTELGLYKDLITADKITEMGLNILYYTIKSQAVTRPAYSDYGSTFDKNDFTYTTRNAEEIAEAFRIVTEDAPYDTNTGSNMIEVLFLTDRGTINAELSYSDDAVPEFFKEIAKKSENQE